MDGNGWALIALAGLTTAVIYTAVWALFAVTRWVDNDFSADLGDADDYL